MNVYTCIGFKGHWPVGTSALIVAENKAQADSLLRTELQSRNLPQDEPLIITKVDVNQLGVHILQDGDY